MSVTVDVSARIASDLRSMAARDWANLARLVRERRADLGLTQEEVAGAGGPSTATQRLIENQGAESYRSRTFRELEHALRLRSGSVRSALKGGPFLPEEEDEPAAGPADPAAAHLDRTPGLSDEEREGLKAWLRARRELHREAS